MKRRDMAFHYADDSLRMTLREFIRMAVGWVVVVVAIWAFVILLLAAGPR